MKKDQADVSVENEEFMQLEKRLQIKQLQVSSLLEVTQAINNNLTTEKLFRIYEFILRAQIAVKKLIVFYKEEQFLSICKYGIKDDFDEHLLIPYLDTYKKLTFLEDVADGPLADFDIIIPIYHKESPLAYALLGEPEIDQYESLDEKIKFVRTISNIIVVAIENKRLFKKQLEQEKLKRELELAAQVQSLLIPKDLPNDPYLEMAAVYLPHRDIGGDYYDYIKVNDDEMIFCIADISGKGIAAAILMANFQAILRTLVKKKEDFKEFIQTLNETVTEITNGEKFITLFVAQYNIDTRKLEYVNAGHNPPVLLVNGEYQLLEQGCTILGMFDEMPFINIGSVQIPEGALLLNYTDGLTDLENEQDESFTLEKVIDFAKEHEALPMGSFNQHLLNRIMDFKGERLFVDDISILSCRFK